MKHDANIRVPESLINVNFHDRVACETKDEKIDENIILKNTCKTVILSIQYTWLQHRYDLTFMMSSLCILEFFFVTHGKFELWKYIIWNTPILYIIIWNLFCILFRMIHRFVIRNNKIRSNKTRRNRLWPYK